MVDVRYIAVDWSGNAKPSVQRKAIRLAVVESGQLVRLEGGRTRVEVIDLLMVYVRQGVRTYIGMDFAFSFPAWYLRWRGLTAARGLWKLAAREQCTWLNGWTWPFWGRPGRYPKRPPVDLGEDRQFRRTDLGRSQGGPKSVFQVNFPGAVGTGTIRGMPWLVRLQDAGAAIWPFDAPKHSGATVVEIYPRLFYGRGVVTKDNLAGRNSRSEYLRLSYPNLGQPCRDAMIESGDAFDAGVSALFMSAYGASLSALQPLTDARMLLEGHIWMP